MTMTMTSKEEAGEKKASGPPKRLITLEELAKHDSAEDCWVAIHGLVIEVNKELRNEHPGGPEVILALAGKDVSEDFEDIGHSDSAREWTDKLVVGYLDEEKMNAGALIPRNGELSGSSGGPGIGVAPLVLAFLVLVAAYIFYFN
ncbi:unnamed protein product [Amoebophrya sp. A25]|nr:unnamed protein product [Amoebophrya sp. A25]|eukprot:GSA25T00008161001.1